ncbi:MULTISPECIES: SCO4225 family membrane protein [unclassified Streptomyces]|uniref:SCO4225 family membrane protein n=1 Tax=unclassified Streptomyces TaxID=2593676 RepID=UPI003630B7DF
MSTTHKETTVMTESTSTHPVLRTVRLALGSVLARVYLGVIAALAIWAVVVSVGDNPDASFAGVVPLIATAPVSLLVIVLPDHTSMIFFAIGLGALVNAVLIGWCARALGQGRGGSKPTG